jgi:serine/threonine protein kinase
MNYEELLNSKTGSKAKLTRMAIGQFAKKQVGEKYQNVLDVNPQLNDNIKFSEALKADCARNRELIHKYQLHFEPVTEGSDVVRLLVEQGNYMTLAQLLNDHPALVAEKDFVDTLVRQLLDVTEYLHSKGVWHVCYAPQNLLVRKGDNAVLLLSHGSFYLHINNQRDIYEGLEDFVAPEVLENGTVDERCDIYSLGKLMDYLFEQGQMPYEYKRVARKAQSAMPEDRYQTIAAMRKALAFKRSLYQSLIALAAAVVLALVVVGLYFELMPETTEVEFVKPAPRLATDELIEDGFDPAELGVITGDTMVMTEQQKQQQKEYAAKAEQIFRKRFTAEADRLLSTIYDNEHMNASEKKFMSEMSTINEQLIKLQVDLGNEAGLSDARSQLLATQIVESLTEQKKKKLQYHGIQKKK